jgi:uncharacterized protein YdaU (DUF1376 family)
VTDRPQFARLPWFPRDFASSTRGWSLLERGLYRELLDASWDLGSLPTDETQLKRITGVTDAEWRKAWPLVRSKFRECGSELVNDRLEEHRAEALAFHLAKSRAGKAGARATWERRGDAAAMPMAEPKSVPVAESVALPMAPPTAEPPILPMASNSNSNSNSDSESSGLGPPNGRKGGTGKMQDPIVELWKLGISMLVAAGKTEPTARRVIGGWLKAPAGQKGARERAVAEALAAAAATRAVDPVAYVSGVLRSAGRRARADEQFAVHVEGDPP